MPKKIKVDEKEFELPEGYESLDDLVKKFTEINGQLPTLQQAAALADKFKAWGNPDDLEARLNTYVQNKVTEAVNAAKAEGATKAQAKAAGDETADAIYDRFDDMSGKEKVAFLTQQMGAQVGPYIQQIAENYWKQAQTQLAGATSMNQQQFDLFARAMEMKQQHPELNVGDIWKTMQEIATAKPERLMEIAYQSVNTPEMLKAKEKEWRAQWENEAKTKKDAENLKVLNSDSVPSWMKPREERVSVNKDGEEAVKNSILQKFMSEGKLRPEQIN